MQPKKYKIIFLITFMVFLSIYSKVSLAEGIVLGGTRVIVYSDKKNASISLRNTSDKMRYMVQTWPENAEGKRSDDIVITPPVFVSSPKNDNILRVMFTGILSFSDRESLYYLNVKAIPSVDKKDVEGNNILMLAAITRIKIFIRPHDLPPMPDNIASKLNIQMSGSNIIISNPTPYYITMVNIKSGSKELESIMVPPLGESVLLLPNVKRISFQTVNDHGGFTPEVIKSFI
ncbi:fimbria/pilus periplasmic chaperone [Serratia marcescens]|nr:fimbria/pilus periplasmic chaperone [Serratia marcescens]MBH2866238.1 fimbria/pilus periplasmic chaperone [Serratia marcescens]MBW4239669.1 fimbria/pilus periplasmic chaperone [Enterobacter roggenkampii]